MLDHFSTATANRRRNSQEANREITIRRGGRKGECEVTELKRRVLRKAELLSYVKCRGDELGPRRLQQDLWKESLETWAREVQVDSGNRSQWVEQELRRWRA